MTDRVHSADPEAWVDHPEDGQIPAPEERDPDGIGQGVHPEDDDASDVDEGMDLDDDGEQP